MVGNSGEIGAAAEVLGSLAIADGSLAPYCTYRVGGPAALLVEANSLATLERIREAVVVSGCRTLVVGRGSNLLVSDRGFAGIAVHLGEAFAGITVPDKESGPGVGSAAACPDGKTSVIAGGAALLPVVARKTAAAGLTGFEWAVGVPGSIGGAVRMNAGGHGSDMAASLLSVSVFDLCPGEQMAGDRTSGGPREWTVDELDLSYRQSALGPGQVVLHAELALSSGDATTSSEEISEIVRWRRQHQPGGQNAGSVFTNPAGDSAGRIIDSLGLKGFRVGSAAVSTKHANFIQADPDGSADDVWSLIREVRLRVATATGIELEVENRLIGFESINDRGGR